MTNLNAMGLTELNQKEMNEIDGGLPNLLFIGMFIINVSWEEEGPLTRSGATGSVKG